jgi:hypothetical protein
MDSQPTDYEKIFSDWLMEVESYGTRCERFYDDASIPDQFQRDVIMTRWLKQAFLLGVEAGKAK